jgi:hypothetical protein
MTFEKTRTGPSTKKIGLLVVRKSLQMSKMVSIPPIERAPTDIAARRKRHVADPRPPRMRSAVTNGARLFVEGSGISAWSRRYADLIAGHCSDLGGREVLSEAQFSLIRRASTIECELEVLEGRMSQGAEVNLDHYGRGASHLRRILESLGLERKPRDVTPFSPSEFDGVFSAAEEAAGVKPRG